MTDFFKPSHKYVRHQNEISAKSVDKVGGKGSSLGELASIVRVPPFFCLTVKAFDYFIDKEKLEKTIERLIEEKKYNEIQTLIIGTNIPEKLQKVITEALAVEPFPNVKYFAVRSSSISEDSEAATYAGQYETYLFVKNDLADISLNIKKCWASLFEERAIVYRSQLVASCRGEERDTDWKNARLGVVIQQQIPSDVSGVMFTVDPVSQSRLRLTIDSIWGLGEAFVSGHVNPDHFVIERTASKALKIAASAVSKKEMRMLFNDEKVVEESLVGSPLEELCSMSDAVALKLAEMGEKIQTHYKKPMDVEYGIVLKNGIESLFEEKNKKTTKRGLGRTGSILGRDNSQRLNTSNNNTTDPNDVIIYILQARPITTLYPAFSNLGESDMLHCFRTLFCWGYLQVQTDPMTPLGLDMIAPYASIWGPPFEAGGRIYIDTSFAGVNPMLRFAQMLGFKYTDQEASEIMTSVYSNMKLMRKIKRERSVINQQLGRLLNVINKTLYNYYIHTWHGIKRISENNIKYIEDKYIKSVISDNVMRYGGRYFITYFWSQCSDMVPDMYLRLFPVMYAGVFAYIQMKKKIRKYFNMPPDATTTTPGLTPIQIRALELFEIAERGFSGNPSTEMEIAVGCIVNAIRPAIDRGLFDDFVNFEIEDETKRGKGSFALLKKIKERLSEHERENFNKHVERFFRNFGFRGPLEIDVGIPRYRENPSILINYIKACITAHIVKQEKEEEKKALERENNDVNSKEKNVNNEGDMEAISKSKDHEIDVSVAENDDKEKITDSVQKLGSDELLSLEDRDDNKKKEKPKYTLSESSSMTYSIVQMTNTDAVDPAVMQNIRFKEGENAIMELRGMLKGKRAKTVYKKLKLMRCGQSYREHHKWLMVRMLSVFRVIIIKRIVPLFKSHNIIETSDDIFFLKANEICDICDTLECNMYDEVPGRKQAFAKLHKTFGPSQFKDVDEEELPDKVKKQVEAQKNALEKYKRLVPPRFLSNSGELLIKNSMDSQSLSNKSVNGHGYYNSNRSAGDESESMLPGDKMQLCGVGASAGYFKGKCCVAKSPHESIEQGCVLVCMANDAGWAPLLSTCSALVIEIGGVMTHGSVVARELGIPCVVGVTGAMSLIKTGDILTVDGTTGVVLVERGEVDSPRWDSRSNYDRSPNDKKLSPREYISKDEIFGTDASSADCNIDNDQILPKVDKPDKENKRSTSHTGILSTLIDSDKVSDTHNSSTMRNSNLDNLEGTESYKNEGGDTEEDFSADTDFKSPLLAHKR